MGGSIGVDERRSGRAPTLLVHARPAARRAAGIGDAGRQQSMPRGAALGPRAAGGGQRRQPRDRPRDARPRQDHGELRRGRRGGRQAGSRRALRPDPDGLPTAEDGRLSRPRGASASTNARRDRPACRSSPSRRTRSAATASAAWRPGWTTTCRSRSACPSSRTYCSAGWPSPAYWHASQSGLSIEQNLPSASAAPSPAPSPSPPWAGTAFSSPPLPVDFSAEVAASVRR